MKSTISLTVDDLIAAQKLHLRPRKAFLFLLAPLVVIVAALALFGVVNAFLRDSSDKSWWWAIGLLAYFGLLYYRIVYSSARTQFKQSKKLSVPFELEFTDESYRTRADWGSSEMKYTEFHKWRFNETVILLYHSDKLFQMIPRRAFPSDDDRNRVLENIRNKAGQPK
jgi:hypothetical protein